MANTKTLLYENTGGSDVTFTLPDDDASIDNIQMTVITGTAYVKGTPGTLFGISCNEIPLYPGQSVNFIVTGIQSQGKRIFRIPPGSKVSFVADN